MTQKLDIQDWAKRVDPLIFEGEKLATERSAPPFPWEKLREALSATFHLKEVHFELTSTRWDGPKAFTQGMGRKPKIQPITFSPLEGTAYWILSQGELRNLMGFLVTGEAQKLKLPDVEMEEGFYEFLTLEALHTLNQVSFFKETTPALGGQEPLPEESALLFDFTLQVEKTKFPMRLVCSSQLYQDWMKHFSVEGKNGPIPADLAEKTPAILHAQIGSTHISLQEWKAVKPGDFLLLDQCSWQPQLQEIPVTVTCKETPLFKGSFSHNQLKILDFTTVESQP